MSHRQDRSYVAPGERAQIFGSAGEGHFRTSNEAEFKPWARGRGLAPTGAEGATAAPGELAPLRVVDKTSRNKSQIDFAQGQAELAEAARKVPKNQRSAAAAEEAAAVVRSYHRHTARDPAEENGLPGAVPQKYIKPKKLLPLPPVATAAPPAAAAAAAADAPPAEAAAATSTAAATPSVSAEQREPPRPAAAESPAAAAAAAAEATPAALPRHSPPQAAASPAAGPPESPAPAAEAAEGGGGVGGRAARAMLDLLPVPAPYATASDASPKGRRGAGGLGDPQVKVGRHNVRTASQSRADAPAGKRMGARPAENLLSWLGSEGDSGAGDAQPLTSVGHPRGGGGARPQPGSANAGQLAVPGDFDMPPPVRPTRHGRRSMLGKNRAEQPTNILGGASDVHVSQRSGRRQAQPAAASEGGLLPSIVC